jgi:hypothetical protein
MTRPDAGLAIQKEKCVIFFEDLMAAFEDLRVIFQIHDGRPNNALTAVSLNLSRAVEVTCYRGQGSLSISLPALNVGKYEGELTHIIKEELGLKGFEYFHSEDSLLNVDPRAVAKAFANAVKVLDGAFMNIRLVESNLRTLKKDATDNAAAEIKGILQKHKP